MLSGYNFDNFLVGVEKEPGRNGRNKMAQF